MEKKLTPEIKLYKEEFDFLHKKIGELEWEIATILYGRKAVTRSEIETLEDRLKNYRDNIGMLVEKIRDEVAAANKSK
jgi:predicted  nucleic acid-binding Zn-ribbon protein